MRVKDLMMCRMVMLMGALIDGEVEGRVSNMVIKSEEKME